MTCIEAYPEVYYSAEVGMLLNTKPKKPTPPLKPQQPQKPIEPINDNTNPALALVLFLVFAIIMIVIMVNNPYFQVILSCVVVIGWTFFWMLTKFWDSNAYELKLDEYKKAINQYPQLYKQYQSELIEYEILKKEYDRQLEEMNNEENLAKFRKLEISSWINNRNIPDFMRCFSNDIIKKGKSEELFANLLFPFFDQIIVDSKIPVGNTFYYPDILIISKNLYIDIEIDEPYAEDDGTPIHYLEDNYGLKVSVDRDRNEYLTENGFEVIRFSEEQIYCNPNKCIDFIIAVIQSIEEGKSVSDCSHDWAAPKWDMEQAIKMAYKHYRESYLSNNTPSETNRLTNLPELWDSVIINERYKRVPGSSTILGRYDEQYLDSMTVYECHGDKGNYKALKIVFKVDDRLVELTPWPTLDFASTERCEHMEVVEPKFVLFFEQIDTQTNQRFQKVHITDPSNEVEVAKMEKIWADRED